MISGEDVENPGQHPLANAYFLVFVCKEAKGKDEEESAFTVRRAIHSLEQHKGSGSLQKKRHFSQPAAHLKRTHIQTHTSSAHSHTS